MKNYKREILTLLKCEQIAESADDLHFAITLHADWLIDNAYLYNLATSVCENRPESGIGWLTLWFERQFTKGVYAPISYEIAHKILTLSIEWAYLIKWPKTKEGERSES